MRKSIVIAIALLAGAGSPAFARISLNPEGWIQAEAWNFLFPLINPYGCGGGGPDNMLRNWVAPHRFPLEGARDGTTWGDILFGGEALATGYEMADLWAAVDKAPDHVRWFTYDRLLEMPGVDLNGPLPPSGDLIDFRAMVDFLDAVVIPGLPTYVPPLLSENVLALAQTYIANRTDEPLCLRICTRSDDSIQVWLDDRLVTNASACRTAGDGCAETAPVLVDPGVHRISVAVWQGTGDWSFGLGIGVETDAGFRRFGDFDQDQIEFLGTEPGEDLGAPSTPLLVRSAAAEESCPGSGPVAVTIRGDGQGSGPVTVLETYPAGEVGDITEVTAGGRIERDPASGRISIRWSVTADLLDREGIGYRVAVPPGGAAHPAGTYGPGDLLCRSVDGDAQVLGPWESTGPVGLFDDSRDVGTAAGIAGLPGSLAVDPGPDGTTGTEDDVYTIVGSGSGVGDGGDSFHFAYRKVTGDFWGEVRIADREFPAIGGRGGLYGLMVRADCSPDSKFSLIGANLEADPGPNADHPRGDAVEYRFRRSHRQAASTDSTQRMVFPDPDGDGPLLVNQPNFFRLERRGTVVNGYASFDGKSWKLIGSDRWPEAQVPADAPVLVGIFYLRNASAPAPGSVSFTGFELGPPPRVEVFSNDEGSPAHTLYRSNLVGVADGGLPPDISSNCAGNCGFTPQVQGGRLRLTEDGVSGTASSVFLQQTVPIGTGKVTIEYTVWARHEKKPGDPGPGDGVTMTIVGGKVADWVGLPGGDLGYGGFARSFDRAAPSFSVEADTWSGGGDNEGAGSPSAPGAWHVGINTAGNVNSIAMTSTGLPDLFSKAGVRFRVEVTSEGTVSVSIVKPGGGGASDPVVEGAGDPLTIGGNTEATIGFTGSTGDGTQTTEVGDVDVTVEDCSASPEVARIIGPDAAPPDSTVVLDGTASTPGKAGQKLSYTWSVVSGSATLDAAGPEGIVRVSIQDGDVIVGLSVDDFNCRQAPTGTATMKIAALPRNWKAYDGNGDGKMDIADPILHLAFLFQGGTPPRCAEAMDFNADGKLDLSDAVSSLSFLFQSGPPPRAGPGCQAFAGCGSVSACP